MALPKNYQQTTNLEKRIKALNDLNFYVVNYLVVLKENVIDDIYKNNHLIEELEDSLGSLNFIGNGKIECVKRFSGLTEEVVKIKVYEFLEQMINSGVISKYIIKDILEKSFEDELLDSGLLEIIKKGVN
jgi:hypothetical protein